MVFKFFTFRRQVSLWPRVRLMFWIADAEVAKARKKRLILEDACA